MSKGKSFLAVLAVVVCCAAALVFAADNPVKVLLYGEEISFDVNPQIIGGYTMIPVRATIESITGKEMDWDAETRTATFYVGNGTTECKHTIGENVVYIDGEPVEFAAPSIIVENRALVPLRMIAEISGLNVDWDPVGRRVLITPATEHPIITGEIVLAYDTYNVTGAELDDAPDAPNYIGSYMMPYIMGLEDKEFESYVNEYLADAVEKPVKEFENEYNELLASIDEEKDEEFKADLKKAASRYAYSSQTILATTSKNYFAVAEAGYEYKGGAHPSTFLLTFNFDIDNKKIMKLGDMFEDNNWKTEIEKKLVEMSKTEKYKDLLFVDAKITVSDESNFFLTDGSLVIFFQPYEIGSYASGYIVFEMPFGEIEDLMKEEFKNAEYKAEWSVGDLFSKAFEQLTE